MRAHGYVNGYGRTVVRFLAAVCLLLTLSVAGAEQPRAKYVFFMIGDGMGAMQRESAERALSAERGAPTRLWMNQLPVTGEQTTSPADKGKVTDSAAAVTALATGHKTHNGIIGIDADGKRVQTVAEYAHAQGLRVGDMTTVTIDHATPAGFYAHSDSRNSYQEIADQMVASDFEYFAGGGFSAAAQMKKGNGFARLLDRVKQSGRTIVRSVAEAEAVAPGTKLYFVPEKLAAGENMPLERDRGPGEPTLADLVRQAIRQLYGDKGFFMMAEGGSIDKACHANDLAASVGETLDFDDAVSVALEFQRAHPDETLVVVTADHETGGLKHAEDVTDPRPIVLRRQTMSGQALSDKLDTMAKEGAGEDAVIEAIRAATGAGTLTADDMVKVRESWSKRMSNTKAVSRYGKINQTTKLVQELVARHAGYSYTSGGHTGVSVPVTAVGVGAEAFAGAYDNTDIARKLFAAVGGAAAAPAAAATE